MKTALILAALLAASAHAQTITHIAEDLERRILLTDEPCPTARALGVAVYRSAAGTAEACWWEGADGSIRFGWFKADDGLPLPRALPADLFREARP